ncbi:MAG: hypothetical protein C0391_04760 [Anaerolinea sp.]|nr:hypothetical protein [Anaerolinea sp.]
MILITGASGKTGIAIMRALREKNIPVRAFINKPQYQTAVISAGASEVIIGNITNKQHITEALNKIDAIYHICPNMHPQEYQIGKNIISACESAGCRYFYYHSVYHPQIRKMPHHWQKMRVEALLFESKLQFTVFQPTAYMQNIAAYWAQIEQGKFIVPYPVETRISLIDLEDLAQAVAQVLSQNTHQYAIYELVGTEPISQIEIAAELSSQLGYKVAAESIPHGTWKLSAQKYGLSDYAINTLLSMFNYYQNYGLKGNPSVLTYLLHRKPTGLVEYINKLIFSLRKQER